MEWYRRVNYKHYPRTDLRAAPFWTPMPRGRTAADQGLRKNARNSRQAACYRKSTPLWTNCNPWWSSKHKSKKRFWTPSPREWATRESSSWVRATKKRPQFSSSSLSSHLAPPLDVASSATSCMPVSFISTGDLLREAAMGGSSDPGLYLRQQDLDLVKEIR